MMDKTANILQCSSDCEHQNIQMVISSSFNLFICPKENIINVDRSIY